MVEFWKTVAIVLQPFLGLVIGFVIGFLGDRWRTLIRENRVRTKRFFDVLDVSITYFTTGKMEIRTQIEEGIRDLFSGEMETVLKDKISDATEKASCREVVITPHLEDRDLIYNSLRNEIFGRSVNVFENVSRQKLSGQLFEEVEFTGALTFEPQFDTTCEDWIKVMERAEVSSSTIQKTRLLLFPTEDLERLIGWCESQAKIEGVSRDHFLDELCHEKHVILKPGPDVSEIRKKLQSQGVSPEEAQSAVIAGQGKIDRLIEFMGAVSRPVDRKRYVAMAQVARSMTVRNERVMQISIPIPISRNEEFSGEDNFSNRSRVALEKTLGKEHFEFLLDQALGEIASRVPPDSMRLFLKEQGGVFFPKNPDHAESDSYRELSAQPRVRDGEHSLYYVGKNGTATIILTYNRHLLLLRKTLMGETNWALPGGFLQLDQSGTLERPRDCAIRELCEEAIVASPGDANYAGLLEKIRTAGRLVYIGPVSDRRNEREAWIQDHVYHLDVSGMPLTLREEGISDPSECASHAEWVPIETLFSREGNDGVALVDDLFGSHGTMVREWADL